MKKILSALTVSALFIIAVSSCRKSQDVTPVPANAGEASNSTVAINDSAILDTGVCAMLHGLSGYTNTNYNNFVSFQTTVWTYLGVPAPRRSLLKFDFTGLNPNCTSASLVAAKLYLYQYDELGNTGNYYSIGQVANDAEIRRVRAAWNPATVTWNTQPTVAAGLPSSSNNAVAITSIATPFSGSQDNQVIDITNIVKQQLSGGAPYLNNNGIMIRFPNGRETQFYKGRTYGSFGSTLTSVRPVLKLYWQ